MLSPCAAPRWPDSKQRQLARSPHVRRFAPRAFSGEAGRKDVAADWAAAPDERSVPRRPQRTELERVQFQLNQAQEPGQAAARLARYLHRCSTWQDLAVAWAQVGPQMNAVHLAALLVRAAKLPAPGYRDGNDLLVFNTFVSNVLGSVLPVLPSCGPREVSSIAWAAARLKAMPADEVTRKRSGAQTSQLRDNAQASSAQANAAATAVQPGSQQLAVMQYSGFIERHTSPAHTNSLSAGVTAQWWGAVLQRCFQLLPQFNGQDLSMVLWAVVALQQHLEQSYQRPLHHNPQSAHTPDSEPGAEDMNSTQGQTRAAADARAQLRVWQQILPVGFIARVLQVSEKGMGGYGPQALSGLVWALAQLRVLPSLDWQDRFLQRSATQLPQSAPQAIANTAWALTVLEASPPPEWFKAFLHSSLDCAALAPPASIAQVLWSAARLPHFRPPQRWVAGVCSAVRPEQLQHFSSQDLANTLWAVSALRHQPPAEWMQAAVAALQRHAPRAPVLEVSAGLTSLARLNYHPGAQVLLDFASLVFNSPESSTQEVCNILWALATLKTRPPATLMKQALKTVHAHLEDIGPQELAQLWWSLGVLRVAPPPGLVSLLHEELLVQREAMQPQELAMLLLGYARLGVPVDKPLLDSLTSQIFRGLKGMFCQGRTEHSGAVRACVLFLFALATIARLSRSAQGMGQGSFVQELLACCAWHSAAAVRGPGPPQASEPLGWVMSAAHVPLSGWSLRDVVTTVSALSDLRQPIHPLWALRARLLVLQIYAEGQGVEATALSQVLRLTIHLCTLHRGRAGLRSRRLRLPSQHQSRPTPSVSTGLPLAVWAAVLVPWLCRADSRALQSLRPYQLAQLCWATALLAAHTRRRKSGSSTVKPIRAAHTRAVSCAVEAAAAGRLTVQHAALVLTSMTMVGPRITADVQRAAERLLSGPLQPARDSALDARQWCVVLKAAAELRVPGGQQWLFTACSSITAVLSASKQGEAESEHAIGSLVIIRPAMAALERYARWLGSSSGSVDLVMREQVAQTLVLLEQARKSAAQDRSDMQLRRIVRQLAR